MRRIRGFKNIKNNSNIYLTPQKKRKKRRNVNYEIFRDKNQSTAAITEGNSNIFTNNKSNNNILFNSDSNKNKFKEISQRLKMEMNN